MITDPKNMFWDSCVFIRFITRQPAEGLSDLDDFVSDARRGSRAIYHSTITFTEILPKYFRGSRFGSIHDFFADMASACHPLDPSPDILIRAGELRGCPATNPSDPKATPRVIGTPDSIHLMSCVHLRDVRKISDIVFHTYDDGKGTTWEGRCVPLLSFDRWYPANTNDNPRVAEVLCLDRTVPTYPQLRMLAGGDG